MGGIVSKFFPKFFPEIFHEYFTRRIEPPNTLSKCHIWGGYGGGEGVRSPLYPRARMVEEGVIVNNLLWKISCHLFGGMKRDHYLCIDNGSETDTIVE
jgi:hypothetical protein